MILTDCFIQNLKIKAGNGVGSYCEDRKADSPEHCQRLCQLQDGCKAFIYVTSAASVSASWKNSCCFKSVLPSASNTEVAPDRVTGPKLCKEGRSALNKYS